jgi:hypothetical protein
MKAKNTINLFNKPLILGFLLFFTGIHLFFLLYLTVDIFYYQPVIIKQVGLEIKNMELLLHEVQKATQLTMKELSTDPKLVVKPAHIGIGTSKDLLIMALSCALVFNTYALLILRYTFN